MIDKKYLGILLLGFIFTNICSSFTGMTNIQIAFMKSLENDGYDAGSGYISLFLINLTLGIIHWLIPSIVILIGSKTAMFFCGLFYLLFHLSFLYPKWWLLYVACIAVGIGHAQIWASENLHFALITNDETVKRNYLTFWFLSRMKIIGNIISFYFLYDRKDFDADVRKLLIIIFASLTSLGTASVIFLPKVEFDDSSSEISDTIMPMLGFVDAIQFTIKKFFRTTLFLLTFVYFYTGVAQALGTIHSTCIGFTKIFGNAAKSYIPLAGISRGCGEILADVLFLHTPLETKIGKLLIFFSATIIILITSFVIFLNIPEDANFKDTNKDGIIHTRLNLALVCSFLLGFGRASINIQIYALLYKCFPRDIEASTILYKSFQGFGAASCFIMGYFLNFHVLLACTVAVWMLCVPAYVIALKKSEKLKRTSASGMSLSK